MISDSGNMARIERIHAKARSPLAPSRRTKPATTTEMSFAWTLSTFSFKARRLEDREDAITVFQSLVETIQNFSIKGAGMVRIMQVGQQHEKSINLMPLIKRLEYVKQEKQLSS